MARDIKAKDTDNTKKGIEINVLGIKLLYTDRIPKYNSTVVLVEYPSLVS